MVLICYIISYITATFSYHTHTYALYHKRYPIDKVQLRNNLSRQNRFNANAK